MGTDKSNMCVRRSCERGQYPPRPSQGGEVGAGLRRVGGVEGGVLRLDGAPPGGVAHGLLDGPCEECAGTAANLVQPGMSQTNSPCSKGAARVMAAVLSGAIVTVSGKVKRQPSWLFPPSMSNHSPEGGVPPAVEASEEPARAGDRLAPLELRVPERRVAGLKEDQGREAGRAGIADVEEGRAGLADHPGVGRGDEGDGVARPGAGVIPGHSLELEHRRPGGSSSLKCPLAVVGRRGQRYMMVARPN